MTEFVLLSFVVWRLTYMLVEESGPYKIFDKMRSPFFSAVKISGVEIRIPANIIGELIECFYCSSIWCSLLVVLVLRNASPVVYWLACSGAAILIEELRRRLT